MERIKTTFASTSTFRDLKECGSSSIKSADTDCSETFSCSLSEGKN